MERTVIKIDEDLCNGCGNCVKGCHEGALQIVNGKAMMISDLYCDGLGACIGECPTNAITFQQREAEPYNEAAVMERLAPKGEAAILAHLRHLHDHEEHEWVSQGLDYIKKHNIEIDTSKIRDIRKSTQAEMQPLGCGCPGSMAREIGRTPVLPGSATQCYKGSPISHLRHFPIQLHLANPQAAFFRGADLLLAADCTAFACGDFHNSYLSGKSLVIGCPKLDSNINCYIEKLSEMIDSSKINTLTVLIMEVPCCRGLVNIAEEAIKNSTRKVPIKVIVISVSGEAIEEKWL